MRLSGRKPAHPVFLTLVPELLRFLPEQGIAIETGCDFAAVTGLSVWLCCHSSRGEQALRLVDQILPESPYDLIFWVIDRGVAQNIVEHGIRTSTRAVPNDSLRPLFEKLKCAP